MRNRYTSELDYLRFIAAFFVVLFHFGQFGYLEPTTGERGGAFQAYPFIPGWASFGWVGVQFFFVLSGYVISRSLEGKTAFEFAVHRAIRVMPALWIMMTIAMIVRIVFGEMIIATFSSWLRAVLLSPVGPYVDGIVWTLVVEVVFYGLFFIGLLVRPKRSRDICRWVGLGLTFWSGLFNMVHFSSLMLGYSHIHTILDRYYWIPFLGVHGIYFSMGILLARVDLDRWRVKHYIHCSVLLFFAVIQIYNQSLQQKAELFVPLFIWLVLIVYMAASVLKGERSNKQSAVTLGKALGRTSYTLYLGHHTIGMFSTVILAHYLGTPPSIFAFLAQITCIIFFAFVIAHFIERPIQRWLAGWIIKNSNLLSLLDRDKSPSTKKLNDVKRL